MTSYVCMYIFFVLLIYITPIFLQNFNFKKISVFFVILPNFLTNSQMHKKQLDSSISYFSPIYSFKQ